jgi:hypothetical protein
MNPSKRRSLIAGEARSRLPRLNHQSVQVRSLDRQAYENASRAWIATLDANITAVFLYDSLRSVQSETKTLAGWSGGKEWFKNPVV